MQSHYCILSSHSHNWDTKVSKSLLCSTMTNLYYFSTLKLLCRPIFPKSKAKVMGPISHTLLTEWCGSSSHSIAEQLRIRVITPISRIIDKN